jgi:hypothetical protein
MEIYMKRIALLLMVLTTTVFAQNKSVTVCWIPEDGTQTCQTFAAGTVTMITVDLRQTPAEYVVVQTLPPYVIGAMQTHVTNQTYNMQQADGSILTKPRYSSVQDLLMQYLIRSVIVPVLQLYPPTGADAGKTTVGAVAADLAAGTHVTVIQ